MGRLELCLDLLITMVRLVQWSNTNGSLVKRKVEQAAKTVLNITDLLQLCNCFTVYSQKNQNTRIYYN